MKIRLQFLFMQVILIIFLSTISLISQAQSLNWQQFGAITGGYTFAQNAGSTKLYLGNNDGIMLSSDSGATWKNIFPITGPSSSGINAVITKNDTVYGDFSGCSLKGVRYTANDGVTWARIDPFISTSYGLAANATSLYVAAYDYIYYTHNNGNSWQVHNTLNSNLEGALSVAADGNTICVGGSFKHIHISHDNGNTWMMRPIHGAPSNTSVWSIHVSGNRIFAGTTSGLYKSIDNGINWSTVFSNQNISAIKFYGQYGFIGTFDQGNKVYFSSDFGNTWTVANANLPSATIWDFTFIGNKVIACTSGSGIWYANLNPTAINGITSTDDEYTIFPNPANNHIILNGYSKEQSLFSILNSAGKEVLKTILNSSSETNNMNIDHLSNGLYFWKITNGDGFVQSGRLAIIR